MTHTCRKKTFILAIMFLLSNISLRPKKKSSLFPLTALKKVGSVGRKMFLFYFIFLLYFFTSGHIKTVSWLIYQLIAMTLNGISLSAKLLLIFSEFYSTNFFFNFFSSFAGMILNSDFLSY